MKALVLCTVGWLFIGVPLGRQTTPPSREFEIKALFLFNFVQFVDWPTNAFKDADSPLVIGVLGDNPFGNYLATTINGENIDQHPLIVKYFDDVDKVQDCQLVFINLNQGRQKAALGALDHKPVLTVGDRDDFISDGGMIRFYVDHNRIRFEVNVQATRESKLQLSSKLLRLARLVNN